MIRTKEELLYYLNEDRKALNIPRPSFFIRIVGVLFPNEIHRFEIILRKTEYYYTQQNFIGKIKYYHYKAKLRRQSIRLGFSIPINVCGPGLSIVHYGTIVISENAHIGRNCRIHTCVNIGASAGRSEAPTLGDNIYIGPGAILFGDIKIVNNVTIGANATVNKSCKEENAVLAGSPASIVKHDYPNWIALNKMGRLGK